jgi:hypothetical protein
MKNELDSLWKEVIMSNYRFFPQNYLQGRRKKNPTQDSQKEYYNQLAH